MNCRFRPLVVIIGLSLATSVCGQATSIDPAQPSAATAGGPDVTSADLLALLSEQPAWSASVALHGAAGYNDNLLLSHAAPEESAFVRSGIESLLWHVPRNRVDYLAFVNAEETHYFSSPTVQNESEAFAGFEWRYRWPNLLNFAIDAQAYYLDQIFDVSDTNIKRVVAELKLSGYKVGPTIRWMMLPSLWIEGTAKGDVQRFRDHVNDADVLESSVRLGWQPTDSLELSMMGANHRYDYKERPRYTEGGQIDDSALLRIHEREAEGRIVLTIGRAKHWKITTRVGGYRYLDNGAGYLNFGEHHAAQEVDWAAGAWNVHVEAEAARKKYEVQTVGQGIALAQQRKNEYLAQIRIERKITERWTLYTEFNWDDTASNDAILSYHMKEGLLGARWSWEK